MKKLIILLFFPLFVTAQIQMSQVSGLIPKLNSKQDSIQRGTGFLKRVGLIWSYDPSTYLTAETDPIFNSSVAKTINATDTVKWNAKQNQINGTGFVKASGTTLSYDNSTYSTDIHSNITALNAVTNTNTGDETLSSIKTKLGYANTSTDGYLKYQDWNTFNNKLSSYTETDPTIYAWAKSSTKPSYTYSEVGALSSGTSFRTVNSVSVVGSGDISINPFPGFGTAHSVVAYGDHLHSGVYEPIFSKNTAFNKNFGTTTSQVWGYDAHPTTISGYGITDIPTYSGNNFILNQKSSAQTADSYINGISNNGGIRISGDQIVQSGLGTEIYYNASNLTTFINSYDRGLTGTYHPLSLNASVFNFGIGNAVFSSSITAPKFNATSTSGYQSYVLNGIPTNSYQASTYYATDAGTNNRIYRVGTSYPSLTYTIDTSTSAYGADPTAATYTNLFSLTTSGVLTATSFSGSGSNLTGVQKPITLTTTGTSGASTFDGTTLNVPNYSSGSGGSGGTYAPTITNGSNVSSIGSIYGYYNTVGGVTTMSFSVSMSVSGGSGNINISLPVTASTSQFVITSSTNDHTDPPASSYNSNTSSSVNINVGVANTRSYTWHFIVTYK